MDDLVNMLGQKALFALVGAIGTVVGGCLLYFTKAFFDDYRERANDAKKSAEKARDRAGHAAAEARNEARAEQRSFIDEFRKFQSVVVASHSRMKEHIHNIELVMTKQNGEMKTQLEITNHVTQTATREIHKLEGRVDEHMNLMTNFISSIKALGDTVARLETSVQALQLKLEARSSDKGGAAG